MYAGAVRRRSRAFSRICYEFLLNKGAARDRHSATPADLNAPKFNWFGFSTSRRKFWHTACCWTPLNSYRKNPLKIWQFFTHFTTFFNKISIFNGNLISSLIKYILFIFSDLNVFQVFGASQNEPKCSFLKLWLLLKWDFWEYFVPNVHTKFYAPYTSIMFCAPFKFMFPCICTLLHLRSIYFTSLILHFCAVRSLQCICAPFVFGLSYCTYIIAYARILCFLIFTLPLFSLFTLHFLCSLA